MSDTSYEKNNDPSDEPNTERFNVTKEAKVNILLQGYISNAYIEDFALVSDTAYAAQVCLFGLWK